MFGKQIQVVSFFYKRLEVKIVEFLLKHWLMICGVSGDLDGALSALSQTVTVVETIADSPLGIYSDILLR